MIKLELVSLSTETEKVVKKEFSFPVTIITPIIKEKAKKGSEPTSYVSSGSLWLNNHLETALSLKSGSTVTISDAKTGLFLYDTTSVAVSEQFKKRLTKTNILRISAKVINRIYSDNDLDKSESWVFRMEEVLVDLPWEDNAKVYVFTPLEKRA